jgi:TolB-like protein
LSDAGELDGAIAAWTGLVRNAPEDASAHSGLGTAYLRRGLVELAVQSLVEARRLSPDDPIHGSNLAAAYASLDKRNDAVQQVYAAMGTASDDPVLKHQAATLAGPKKAASDRADARMAILPFDTAGGTLDQPGLGDMVASMTTTAIAGAGGGPIVERARLDRLLAEQDLQSTQRFDPSTAVKIGKLSGATLLLVGNVARVGQHLRVDARVLDVQTGQVVRAWGGSAEYELGSIQGAVDAMTRALLAR